MGAANGGGPGERSEQDRGPGMAHVNPSLSAIPAVSQRETASIRDQKANPLFREAKQHEARLRALPQPAARLYGSTPLTGEDRYPPNPIDDAIPPTVG
ncbi:MAG: hypothetical protein R3E84_18755 [Pseudomonadales bacterium]